MKKLSVVLLTMLFLLGMATAAFAANYKGTLPGLVYSNTQLVDTVLPQGAAETTNDNVYTNANATGTGVNDQTGASVGNVIKSVGTQRTHGEYQNNTNSCASCHQTHTAAAKNLLFKNSVYNTCTACHDGTLGIYNVFTASTAGTFGGNMEGNASVHLANGTQNINAAPGGKAGGTTMGWGTQFNCASCHAPHGSYSDRLLHYNPNNIGITPPTGTGSDIAGKLKDDVLVYGGNGVAMPHVASVANYSWAVIIDDVANLTVANYEAAAKKSAGTAVYGVASYPVLTHESAGTIVAVAVYENGDKWYASTEPWLYGYSGNNPKNYYTALIYGTTEVQPDDNTTGVHYKWGLGYAELGDGTTLKKNDNTALALNEIVKADIAPATVVDLDFVSTMVNGDGLTVAVVDDTKYATGGKGVKISAFCAACHVDYMVGSGDTKTGSNFTSVVGQGAGTYTFAYRHSTTSDSYTCLRCHFAHGTDVTVMKDAKDETVTTLTAPGGDYDPALYGGDANAATDAAKAYLLDVNPSSALKRYTNMAVCWKCHTDSKATQLKNNTFFWDNYDTVPHGF